jgi:PAS domain S-box-containing protein
MTSKNLFGKAWISFAILIIGIILTIAVAVYTKNDLETIAKYEFALVCNEIKAKVTTRLYSQAQLLRSGSSFLTASDTVTRENWKIFIESSKLNRNLPGIQGVGFSFIVKKEQLPQHIQQIRKEGFPDYSVSPAGDRGIYTSIVYLEPFSDRNLRAFGYDMYSEPIRRKAMEQARDFDVAALSGKVVLVQETGKDLQAGTLMYVPVYQKGLPTNTTEERRTAIIGWVYSPYRMVDLMLGILSDRDLHDNYRIHLQIYDNDSILPNALLFDSQKEDALIDDDKVSQTLTIPIVFNSKKWTLQFSQSNIPFLYFQSKVLIVLFSGFIISVLLFYLSLSLFNTRFKAQQIAVQLTSKLQESEERFAAFMDNLPASAFIKDTNGRNLFFNRHLIEIMGFENWENKLDSDLITVDEAVRMSNDDKKAMESGVNKLEETMMDCNGNYRTFETIKFPIKISENILLLGGISMDITDRKQAEKLLVQIDIQLRELNASKDKFFSIIAHDLRGPLGAVLGLTKLMGERLSGMSSDEIQNAVTVLEKSMTNLNLLVGNLLEWSLMNIGLTIFKPVSFLLLPEIYKNTATIAESATKKGIILNFDIPEELMVYADENMFGSIMRNLITNAVKFTPKGGKVNVLAQSAAGKSIQISIQDTGIGMSQKMVENLFLLNVQNGRKGTDGEPSTGLGLLLCKEFIEKHNGRIWVESEERKGSTFYCTFPYNAEPVVKIDLHKDLPFDKVDNKTIPAVSGLKILIAEDDKISEMLLDIEVKKFCSEILKVGTGIEAVEICRNKTDIDLILMDIQMPEMSGYEATRQIRGFNKEVIIIAQTAYGFSGDREKAIEAGCNEYIAKPIKKAELLALILKYFGK